MNIKATIALTWILFSIIITFLICSDLGVRGWMFLIHHVFCVIGAGRTKKTFFRTPFEYNKIYTTNYFININTLYYQQCYF